MLSCIRLMPANRRPISLRLNTSICSDRSPEAIRSKHAVASFSGCTIRPRSAKRMPTTISKREHGDAMISVVISEMFDCASRLLIHGALLQCLDDRRRGVVVGDEPSG